MTLDPSGPELKSCPWCGSAEIAMRGAMIFYGRCAACYAEGPTANNEAEAIAAWNRRVLVPSGMQQEVASSGPDVRAAAQAALDQLDLADKMIRNYLEYVKGGSPWLRDLNQQALEIHAQNQEVWGALRTALTRAEGQAASAAADTLVAVLNEHGLYEDGNGVPECRCHLWDASLDATWNDHVARIVCERFAKQRVAGPVPLPPTEPDFKGFAEKVIREAWEGRDFGPMDGGDVEDIGVEFGILKPVTMAAPCGENCACEEYAGSSEFPLTCYRFVEPAAPLPLREPSPDLKAAAADLIYAHDVDTPELWTQAWRTFRQVAERPMVEPSPDTEGIPPTVAPLDGETLNAIQGRWRNGFALTSPEVGALLDQAAARFAEFAIRAAGGEPSPTPEGLHVQVSQGIPEGSWLNLDGYAAFREAYGYAETQTRAIPALSKCTADEVYFLFEALKRGGTAHPKGPDA